MAERIEFYTDEETPANTGWYIVAYDSGGAYDAIGPYETREYATMVQGLPVHGYQEQSDINVAIVNNNKLIEETVLRVLDKLKDAPDLDQRWLAIGRTHIEQGFMAVNRAVFKPQRFNPPSPPLDDSILQLD